MNAFRGGFIKIKEKKRKENTKITKSPLCALL
jgi:hypothetical protein